MGGGQDPGWSRQRVLLVGLLVLGALGGSALVAQHRPATSTDPQVPASSPSSIHLAVIGDFGAGNAAEAAVASMVATAGPDAVVTVGDNAYGALGQDDAVGHYYHAFIGAYAGSYGSGSATNRFFPALGNHDISDGSGLAGYQSFYTLPGAGATSLRASGNERYYDVVLGPVHVFVLDSDPSEPAGITASSAQATWLRNGLAASPSTWNVVVMHHAPYSSSSGHGSTPALQWPYEQWGADLVLAGHDHTYERVVRDGDQDGTSLTYVVDGLGGQSPYGFAANPVSGSQVRFNADNGALFLDASATTLSGQFKTVGGTTPDTFTLTAPALGHITGTITDANGPVAGAMVHAVDYRADPAVIRGDRSDAAGHYDIVVPAPDAYAVGVLDPTGSHAFEYHDDDPSIDPADDTTVAAGATVTVDVEVGPSAFGPGRIEGLVTDGVAPLPGIWVTSVTATGTASHAAVSDAAGHFTITDLPPGSYKLVFVDPAGSWRWEWYDNGTGWGDATAVPVTAGAASSANAALAPAP